MLHDETTDDEFARFLANVSDDEPDEPRFPREALRYEFINGWLSLDLEEDEDVSGLSVEFLAAIGWTAESSLFDTLASVYHRSYTIGICNISDQARPFTHSTHDMRCEIPGNMVAICTQCLALFLMDSETTPMAVEGLAEFASQEPKMVLFDLDELLHPILPLSEIRLLRDDE